MRERTWCLYGDVDRALGELGAPGQDRIVVAALRDGVVVASARGRPTPASLAAIAEALGEA